ASLNWVDGVELSARELLADQLLPLAADALGKLDIPDAEIQRYVGTAQTRVERNRTGARWQRAWVAKHGTDWAALTRAYADAQDSGEPVHEWPV
ncbi:MAG: glutamate--cysteine ligase, partial [Gammaproteobacteria bacterium]|nr:glutamate--cysteine ligase [Gammaproteobacteria bacterium]